MTLYQAIEAAPAVKFEFKGLGALKALKGEDGKLRLNGIASSTIRDLHGDTMTDSALMDMERSANQNLTIFLNHSYEVPEDVGGSVERAVRTTRTTADGSTVVDLDLDIVMDDTNERAVQTWRSIKGGTKLGLSIGANLPEGGYRRNKDGTYIIEHCELLETSIVGVPANPRSWVEYAVKALNEDRDTRFSASTSRTVQIPHGEAILLGATCPNCGGGKNEPHDNCMSSYHTKQAEATPVVVELDEHDADVVASLPPAVIENDADIESTGDPVEELKAIVDIHIDTDNSIESGVGAPSSQEAPESGPGAEAALLDEDADGVGELLGDPVTAEAPAPQVTAGNYAVPAAQMTDLVNSYASTVQNLMTLRLAYQELQTAKVAAERDRDQAIADRDRVLTETTALLTRLADVPMVRKTAVTSAYGAFRERFGGIYDEGFLKMLESNND